MAKTGAVLVKHPDASTSAHTWATSVRVDRKGNLHVYGKHSQHMVHPEGDWVAYIVSAPSRGNHEDV